MSHTNSTMTMMIYIKHIFTNTDRGRVTSNISNHDGVTHAEFSPYVPKVMFIEYNRHITNTQSIRNKIHELLAIKSPDVYLVGM